VFFRYGEKSGDSMHAEPHSRTSCHYQSLPLIPFLSEAGVKRKDFPEIVRLPWAQEASGSNPDAPTISFQINHLQMDNFGRCCFVVRLGNDKKIPSRKITFKCRGSNCKNWEQQRAAYVPSRHPRVRSARARILRPCRRRSCAKSSPNDGCGPSHEEYPWTIAAKHSSCRDASSRGCRMRIDENQV
jgi:hypothetical protein